VELQRCLVAAAATVAEVLAVPMAQPKPQPQVPMPVLKTSYDLINERLGPEGRRRRIEAAAATRAAAGYNFGAGMTDQLGPSGLSARNKATAATLGPTGRSNRLKKGWESGKRETVVQAITPRGTPPNLRCGLGCGAEHYQRGYGRPCYMKEYRKNKK
jgi:hypothetical protein